MRTVKYTWKKLEGALKNSQLLPPFGVIQNITLMSSRLISIQYEDAREIKKEEAFNGKGNLSEAK
jgi:hypothetical protein